MIVVAPDIAAALKINSLELWKKNRFLASCSFRGKNVLFKQSPPSIMVTRNPNWSTEILWYGTGYVKWKILSPLKRSTWGRLHCWFCLKLLNIYSLMLWWFVYNIPDSGASEYSISNNSNSGVGKNSPMNNFNSGVGKKFPPWIIPTLALVKIPPRIIPTLALVKILSYKKNQYIFLFYSWFWYHWISW